VSACGKTMTWQPNGRWNPTIKRCSATSGRDSTRVCSAAHIFRHEARFPANKHEVPSAVVKHVASQVGVLAEAYLPRDWQGRTIKYYRAQIRAALGFREASSQDSDGLATWLANDVVPRERTLDRLRVRTECHSPGLSFRPCQPLPFLAGGDVEHARGSVGRTRSQVCASRLNARVMTGPGLPACSPESASLWSSSSGERVARSQCRTVRFR
jgi:hypothetical protein